VIRLIPPILLMILAILGASLLFVPESGQLALVRYKAQQFAEARQTYEAMAADGDYSVETVRGLAELHIHYGEVERAIEVMEYYLARNPTDAGALRRIAKYYQYAQRYQDYRATLERLRQIDPRPELLRDLAQIYNEMGREEGQIRILQNLVTNPAALPGDYINLAELLASRARLAEAEDILERLWREHPDDFELPAAVLLISVQTLRERPDTAIETGTRWLRAQDDAETAPDVADTLASRADAATTLTFLQRAHAAFPDARLVAIRLAQAEAATGARERGLERLLALREQAPLPDWGVDTAVSIALALDRLELAYELGRARPRALAEATLRSLVERSVETGRAAAAQAIVRALGTEALARTPVLAARLALALGQTDSANAWADRALTAELDYDARFGLVDVLVRLERRADALSALTAFLTQDAEIEAPPWTLRAAAGLYFQFDAEAEGRQVFAQVRARRPEVFNAHYGWAQLTAATGDEELAYRWWQGAKRSAFDNQHLDDLFYAARSGWADALALEVGLVRAERQPDGRRLLELAQVMLDADQPVAALGELRSLRKENRPDIAAAVDETYMAALQAAAQAGVDFGAEARAYALDGLSGQPKPERAAALIELLLASGSASDAMPHIAGMTERDPDRWIPTYVEAARETDQTDRAVDLLDRELNGAMPRDRRERFSYLLIDVGDPEVALPHARRLARMGMPGWDAQYLQLLGTARGPGAMADELTRRAEAFEGTTGEARALAQRLLEHGRKPAAVDLLARVAADAPPDAAIVSELMWLWGPRPPAEGLHWLGTRARQATPGVERAAWARLLLQRGGTQRVVQLLDPPVLNQPTGEDGFSPEAGVAIDALARLGKSARPRLAALLRRIAAGADNSRMHKQVADTAYANGIQDVARDGYAATLEGDPNNPEAMRNLGQLAFFQGDWSRADGLLTRYVALPEAEADFQSHYYLGEIRRRQDRDAGAGALYQASLGIIDRLPEPDTEARVIAALATQRTEGLIAAAPMFEALVADDATRAQGLPAYLRVLLQNGDTERSGRLFQGAES